LLTEISLQADRKNSTKSLFGTLERLKELVDRIEAFFVEHSVVDLTATRCSGASRSVPDNNPSWLIGSVFIAKG
jgi:hypothetical protein